MPGPLLFTLFTYDSEASEENTSSIKSADDTPVIGMINRREVEELVVEAEDNNLSLNADKTKEMSIDPKRERVHHFTEVETFKFLSTHISEDLTWSHKTAKEMWHNTHNAPTKP